MADADVPAVRPEPSGSTTPAAVSALLARRLPGYARLVAAPKVDEAALAFPADVDDLLADPAGASQLARQLAPGPKKRLRI